MRNPLKVLPKGLIAKKDRGDKTAIELFVDGVRLFWDSILSQIV
jgi:hypothetical protein